MADGGGGDNFAIICKLHVSSAPHIYIYIYICVCIYLYEEGAESLARTGKLRSKTNMAVAVAMIKLLRYSC